MRGLDPSQTGVVRSLIQRANTLTQLSLTGAAREILAREDTETNQNQKGREVSPIRGRHMFTLIKGDTLTLILIPLEYFGMMNYSQ